MAELNSCMLLYRRSFLPRIYRGNIGGMQRVPSCEIIRSILIPGISIRWRTDGVRVTVSTTMGTYRTMMSICRSFNAFTFVENLRFNPFTKMG